MNLKTSNYGVARSIAGLIEILLWCALGLGIIIALASAGAASRGFGASGLLAAIPGIGISVVALLGISQQQGNKASIDSADYTYQMLGIARDQLSVSKLALKQAEKAASYSELPAAATAAPIVPATTAVEPKTAEPTTAVASYKQPSTIPINPDRITEYRGAEIVRNIHGYEVLDHTFQTIELAKNFVDGRRLAEELETAKEATS